LAQVGSKIRAELTRQSLAPFSDLSVCQQSEHWKPHAIAAHMAERRIDPEDGKARTFDEVAQRYQPAYTLQQVQEYWDRQCKPVPADLFMTHLQSGQGGYGQPPPNIYGPSDEPPTAPASQVQLGQVRLAEDPFMAAAFQTQPPIPPPAQPSAPVAPVPTNPVPQFQTLQEDHTQEKMGRLSEGAYAFLGAGDPDRQARARTILVLVPVLLFLWEMVVWTLLSHISTNACWLMTVTLSVVSGMAVLMWYHGMRWGPVSLAALGTLCLIAVVMGTALGQRGWNNNWRQFWWMNIGQQIVPTVAATPAGARSDAATLAFASVNGTLDHSSVDISRSVGFKDTHLYCVAPILSPDTAGADFPRVNYWAVGMDCCSKSGTFSCDSSRDYSAGYGVVQLAGGFPCPSCNVDSFQKAIAKAESTYGLVSAPDALLVRWVTSISTTKMHAGLVAVGSLLFDMACGSLLLYVLGLTGWYYGLGKKTPTAVFMALGAEDAQEAKAKRML